MKAIIISDDQNVIDSLDKFLCEKKFDTIIYRWLLKALDNIEEIRPDLVIVSSSEYPRHWKTLAQFIKSGIGGDNTKIILYQVKEFTDEEIDKARKIGVNGSFHSVDFDGLFVLNQILVKENLLSDDDVAATKTETLPSNEDNDLITVDSILDDEFDANGELVEKVSEDKVVFDEIVEVILTHPTKKCFIFGKAVSYKANVLEFKADDDTLISDLEKDTLIPEITISLDNKVMDVNGVVLSKEQNLVLNIESYDAE